MQRFSVILALLIAIQPLLVTAEGAVCGEANCAESTAGSVECGPCPCALPEKPCCCSLAPTDETPRVPSSPRSETEPALRLLLAGFDSAGLITILDLEDGPALESAFFTRGVVAPDRTHNERLALRCILRT